MTIDEMIQRAELLNMKYLTNKERSLLLTYGLNVYAEEKGDCQKVCTLYEVFNIFKDEAIRTKILAMTRDLVIFLYHEVVYGLNVRTGVCLPVGYSVRGGLTTLEFRRVYEAKKRKGLYFCLPYSATTIMWRGNLVTNMCIMHSFFQAFYISNLSSNVKAHEMHNIMLVRKAKGSTVGRGSNSYALIHNNNYLVILGYTFDRDVMNSELVTVSATAIDLNTGFTDANRQPKVYCLDNVDAVYMFDEDVWIKSFDFIIHLTGKTANSYGGLDPDVLMHHLGGVEKHIDHIPLEGIIIRTKAQDRIPLLTMMHGRATNLIGKQGISEAPTVVQNVYARSESFSSLAKLLGIDGTVFYTAFKEYMTKRAVFYMRKATIYRNRLLEQAPTGKELGIVMRSDFQPSNTVGIDTSDGIASKEFLE